jgi:hypothetical protein
MHERTTKDGMTSLGSQLRLPVQAAPVSRTMLASALAGDLGVQPALFAEILGAAGAIVDLLLL